MHRTKPSVRLCLFVLIQLVLAGACSQSDPAPQQRADDSGVEDVSDTSHSDAADADDAPDAATDAEDSDTAPAADADATSDAADAPDTADTRDASEPQVWRPAPGTSWHWQLQGELDTSLDVDMYDIDLFDTSAQTISELQQRGVTVICYFSAGSFEDWRSDADDFESADTGNAMGNWPGEWWLDVRSQNVRDIMASRLDLAVSKGCDGVEPDNVDGYQNDTGFDLTSNDQIDYNRFLAEQAHLRGLSIGLKNAVGLVDQLEPDFDWALNESCLDWNECDRLQPFIDAGKAVFHAEYVDSQAEGPAKQDEVCDEPTTAGFSTLIFTWDLDGWWLDCP